MNDKKLLLESIFNKTGIFISTKNDCRIISQFIANEKIGFLSESTLYRFFYIHPITINPYKNTFIFFPNFAGTPIGTLS